jgi:cytochrome P450
VGSLHRFAPDPLAFLADLHRTGDLVQFTLGPHRLLYTGHPDVIEEALVQRARHLHKDVAYALLKPLLGEGLVTAEDDHWRTNRKLCAPSFTPRAVAAFADTMAACVDRWIDGLPQRAEVDLFHEMMALTADIVLKTLFGDLDVDVSDAPAAVETIMAEFVHDAQGRRTLLPPWLPTPGRRRADRAVAALDALFHRILAARRAQGPGDDLLSHLLAARDDDGRGMDDRQLRDETLTLFSAGHETTATWLTSTLLQLAVHRDEEDRLRADPSRADRVLDETLRLRPPVWTVGRETQAPIDLGGHRIPAGVQLLFAPYVVHRDPRWFDDPLAFRPDRWACDRIRPRFAFFPFGGGPRVCIGLHFAKLEARIALERIVAAAHLDPLGPVPPPSLATITHRPIGRVPVMLTRR